MLGRDDGWMGGPGIARTLPIAMVERLNSPRLAPLAVRSGGNSSLMEALGRPHSPRQYSLQQACFPSRQGIGVQALARDVQIRTRLQPSSGEVTAGPDPQLLQFAINQTLDEVPEGGAARDPPNRLVGGSPEVSARWVPTAILQRGHTSRDWPKDPVPT
eukprot:14959369-Alexandrium_andersonii.AAC.1